MLEHIPGLPDLILFWVNDVSDIRVSRCGITRGTLYGKHVLTLIWVIMTGGSFKIVSNWAVLTCRIQFVEGVPVRALLPILPVLQHHHGGMPAEQVGSVCRLHRVAQRVGEPPNDGTAPP